MCEAGQDGDEALSRALVSGWHRLKGRRHENIEAIQAVAKMELTGIPKEAFISCFQDLQKRWQQFIDCGVNYFEGDRKHSL
jgi:hypothetical protein